MQRKRIPFYMLLAATVLSMGYLIAYFVMVLSGALMEHHLIFILSLLALTMIGVMILAWNERTLLLGIGATVLMVFALIELLLSFLEQWQNMLSSQPWFDAFSHVLGSFGIVLFFMGMYEYWSRRLREGRAYRANFETGNAVRFEYHRTKKTIAIHLSTSFQTAYGLTWERKCVSPAELRAMLHPDDQGKPFCLNGNAATIDPVEYRLKFPNMETYCVLLIKGSYWVEQYRICFGVDVTDVEQLRTQLTITDRQYHDLVADARALFTHSEELIAKIRLDGYIEYASDLFNQYYEIPTGDTVVGKSVFTLNEAVGHHARKWLDETVRHGTHHETNAIHVGGQTIWISWSNRLLFDATGTPESILCFGHDISNVVEANQALEFQNEHDADTGLLNRNGRLKVLERMRDAPRVLCIAFIIKDYSEILGYYGNQTAIEALQAVSQALTSVFPEHTILARDGEASFLVYCADEKLTKEIAVEDEIRAKHATIQEALLAQELRTPITLEVGYAFYPDDVTDFDLLTSRARLAMYQALQDDRTVLVPYHPDLLKELESNVEMGYRLRQAIDHHELQVVGQNVLDVVTQRIVYVESLARWHDPMFGAVAPPQFIKIAQHGGFLEKLDKELITLALQAFSQLRMQVVYEHAVYAVNLAPATFMDSSFPDWLDELCEKFRFPKAHLVLEVSESTFVNDLSVCVTHAKEYQSRGYSLALDDFGREYSSLSVLDETDFDFIKLDQFFVGHLDRPKSKEIVAMTVRIAKLEERILIAEGVETERESQLLEVLGIHWQQGYYHHYPSPMIQEEEQQ